MTKQAAIGLCYRGTMSGVLRRVVLIAGLSFGLGSWNLPIALGAGVPVEKATAAQKKEAQAKFGQAMTDFEAKRYQEAVEGFRASYGVVISPNSRYMIARSLRELGKLNEAAVEYQGTIDEAKQDKKYADARTSASAELEEMRSKAAAITVNVQGNAPDMKVEIGANAVDAATLGAPYLIEPGLVTVVAHSAWGDQKRTVDATAGHTTEVTIKLAPPAPPKPSASAQPNAGETTSPGSISTKKFGMREWSYVAGGVGAAGLVSFTVFGLMNNSKYNELESSCINMHCPSEQAQDLIDTGRTYQTIANISLAVGIAGVGTGAVLYLLSNKKPSHSTASVSAPQVLVGPRTITVGGTF